MGYEITCRKCREVTWANNIVNLISEHINPIGALICHKCGANDAFIYKINTVQEEGEVFERWIKAVITIDTGIDTYSPYIFVTSDTEGGDLSGLHIHYYKDTRPYPNGKLKHGHGPGGPPILCKGDMFTIITHLIRLGALTKAEVQEFANKL